MGQICVIQFFSNGFPAVNEANMAFDWRSYLECCPGIHLNLIAQNALR
jgi:hypothetical protein